MKDKSLNKGINSINKKNKILLFSALGILGAGVAGTICWSIVRTHDSNVRSNQIINEGEFDLKEGEVQRLKDSSINMLAAKTATYYRSEGYSDEQIDSEVNKIIGFYNDVYDESVEQNKQLYKENLVGSMDDANYASLNMLNNEFDIDPIDMDKLESDIDVLEQNIENENKIYKAEVNKNIDLYNAEIKPQINQYNLDNIEASLLFNRLDEETKEENDLQLMADIVRPMIGTKITIRDDAEFNFASKLKVYSKNGNTGYFAANNNDPIDDSKGTIVNDLIEPEDMGELFDMEYDLTKGTIYKETPDSVDYEATSEEDIDITEEEIVAPFIQKAHMNGMEISGGADYAPGEFEPGYQLLTQIVNEDYITNSNYDIVTLKFGVWDKAWDPDQEHVIWLEDDLNMTTNIELSTIEQKRNIADNYYYTQLETVPCDDFYNEDNKEYFKVDQEESNRSTIDEVLSAAPIVESGINKGEYDISESNPYYIDPNSVNLEGISIPEGSWYYNGGHTNEKLQLKVVDVNTNVNGDNNQALKCIWSICDTDPQTGEYVWVKDIQWTNHNGPIWVNFNYNEEDFLKLGAVTSIAATITSLMLFADSLKDKNVDEADSKVNTMYQVNVALSAISTTAAILCDAASALYSVLFPITGGMSAGAIAQLVITSVIDLGFAAFTIYNCILEHRHAKSVHNVRLQWDALTDWLSDEEMQQVWDWSQKLNNPKFNISDKLEIADKLEEFQTGDKWEDFQKTVLTVNGMSEEEYNNFVSICNNPSIDPTISYTLRYVYWALSVLDTFNDCLMGAMTIMSFMQLSNGFTETTRETFENSFATPIRTGIDARLNELRQARAEQIRMLDEVNEADGVLDMTAMTKVNEAIQDEMTVLKDVKDETNRISMSVAQSANTSSCAWVPVLITVITTIGILAGVVQLIIEALFKC